MQYTYIIHALYIIHFTCIMLMCNACTILKMKNNLLNSNLQVVHLNTLHCILMKPLISLSLYSVLQACCGRSSLQKVFFFYSYKLGKKSNEMLSHDSKLLSVRRQTFWYGAALRSKVVKWWLARRQHLKLSFLWARPSWVVPQRQRARLFALLCGYGWDEGIYLQDQKGAS